MIKDLWVDFQCSGCKRHTMTGFYSFSKEHEEWLKSTGNSWKRENADIGGTRHILTDKDKPPASEVCGYWIPFGVDKETYLGNMKLQEAKEPIKITKENTKEEEKIRSLASTHKEKIPVISYKALFKEQTLEGMKYNIQRIREMIDKRKRKEGYSVRHVNWLEGIIKKLMIKRDEIEVKKELPI